MKHRSSIAILTVFTILQASTAPANEREDRIRQLTSALGNMSVYDVGPFLIDVIPEIEGGVGCDDFSKMLEETAVYDRGTVVEKVAPYIHISEGCFVTVSSLVSKYDAANAIKALQRSEKKY